jgi:pimeloyl-ACP methyl ester carboxylesterase
MSRVFASTVVPAAPRSARFAGEGYGVSDQPSWRAVDWATLLQRVRLGAEEVNYVDVGPRDSGGQPPLVFVHGLAGQWQNWLENIPRLARERRVVALDLPGFGGSPVAHERVTIPFYGRCVEALCEHLGLDAVALVGNSMGGFVAAEVAIQQPARVERLALVSAAGISTSALSQAPVLTVGRIAAAMTAYAVPRQRALARRPLTRHLALALVARHPSLLKPDLAYEGFISGAGKPGFNDALRAVLEYDVRERLPEIGCPTLIVWGERDGVIPVRDAHHFERLIGDSRKLLLRDTGHISMAERPKAFNDALLSFLAERGAAEKQAPADGVSRAA